jgi:hypothetical protein
LSEAQLLRKDLSYKKIWLKSINIVMLAIRGRKELRELEGKPDR